MNVERYVRLIGGAMVMLSLALGYFVSPWWLLLTAFMGANLFQLGLSNWCPMMTFLRMLGVREH